MKLTISTSSESVRDSSGASFIGDNGVYDVTINFASIEETTNGAHQLNLNVDYNGNSQVLYGPIIVKKDGNPNEVGMTLLNKIGTIAGLEDGAELTVEEETHRVGKDNKAQDFDVITDFTGVELKLRIQRSYSKYQGNIRRSLEIRNVFRSDGATASEIIADTEVGKQLALEMERYAATSHYDGVTEEEAEAWEQEQRSASKGGKGSKAAPKGKVASKKSSMFGKK